MNLVFGMDDLVARWVALQIPSMARSAGFGPSAAIGVVDEDGNPVAGIVFHNYQPQFRAIEVSCASTTSRWLTKRLASLIMAYPYAQLGVGRCSAITPSGEPGTSVSRFLERFGFVREGVIRRGLGDADAVMWGMLSEEWAVSRYNVAGLSRGQEIDPSARPRSRSRRNRQRSGRRKYRNGAGATAPEHGQHDGA